MKYVSAFEFTVANLSPSTPGVSQTFLPPQPLQPRDKTPGAALHAAGLFASLSDTVREILRFFFFLQWLLKSEVGRAMLHKVLGGLLPTALTVPRSSQNSSV